MAHDVFIAFAPKDKVAADAVCAALEAKKIRSWIAPRDVRLKENATAAVREAIKASRIMVLIFSEHANRSKPVLDQLVAAVNAGKVVIPFKIEDIFPSGAMEFYLMSTHWLDAMNPPTEIEIDNLINTVEHFLQADFGSEKDQLAGKLEAETSQGPKTVRQLIQQKKGLSLSKKLLIATTFILLGLALLWGAGYLDIDFFKDEPVDLFYDGTYIIDYETGTIPLSALSIGARVIDPSWEWEFRSGQGYSGDGSLEPVTWIVVAHEHYDLEEPHTTLLTEELIGLNLYTNRSLVNEVGYYYWGDEEEDSGPGCLLRSWLNSTGAYAGEGFYNAFSRSFKEAVLITTVPNNTWDSGDFYHTKDKVFLPSTTELGDEDHEFTHRSGKVFPFYTRAEELKRVAFIGSRTNNYWTRSPVSTNDSYLYTVGKEGDFHNVIAFSDSGVRPVVNVYSEIMVSLPPEEQE